MKMTGSSCVVLRLFTEVNLVVLIYEMNNTELIQEMIHENSHRMNCRDLEFGA